MVEQLAVDLGEEVAELVDLGLGQLAAAEPLLDALGDGETGGSGREHLSHEKVPPERERVVSTHQQRVAQGQEERIWNLRQGPLSYYNDLAPHQRRPFTRPPHR